MKRQKTRNRHVPLPHMTRLVEDALRLDHRPGDPPLTSDVLAYMREFNVCENTAMRMLRNDPRR